MNYIFNKKPLIMIKKTILALLTLAFGFLSAQTTIDTTNYNCKGTITAKGGTSTQAISCTNASAAYTSKYSKQSFYVPTNNDPVITVKITFHVFNKTDGTGSWPNTPQGVNDLTQIANWMHNWHDRYSDPRTANYTVPGFIPPVYIQDSRVNYEITNIYFYNDNTLNSAGNASPLLNHINSTNPSRLTEGLPIFFNNGCYSGICNSGVAGYQSTANMGSGTFPYVHSYIVAPPMGLFWCHEHLLHELGHAMGWYHTYNIVAGTGNEGNCTSPDFLTDVFPTNNPNCASGSNPCNVCWENGGIMESNNIMSGGNGNGWISPLQMGRRIRNLHLPFNGVRRYVKEMTSSVVGAWQITSNEIWDFDIQMYQDIIVKPGATLTVKCKIGMANNGRIIVERGGKLIIDGGEIFAWARYWSGIQVWGSSNQPQVIAGNGLSVNHGIVQIINQGVVKDAINAITTIKYDENGDWDWGGYTGGIIQCDGAKFINNIRAIQYLSYHNFNPSNNNTIDNIGYIRRSLFETNSVLKDPLAPNPEVFISMWNVDGIKLVGNNYQNTRSPLPSIDLRGNGINSIDASYYVDRYKVCSVYNQLTGECASYSTNVASNFNNLHYGVHVQNSNPNTYITITDNDFVNCNRSVYFAGAYHMSVSKNRINVGEGQNNVQFLPYGIYSENSSAYDISNNTIFTTQTANYNLSLGTGICVYGTNGLNNILYRNSINMMGSGTAVFLDNQGPNPGDGLKLKCNVYGQGSNGKNYIDINMGFASWMNGKIDKEQGSYAEGANNQFSHTGNSNPNILTDYFDNAFTVPSPASSINYYYNTMSGQLTQPWYYSNSMSIHQLGAYDTNMCPVNPNAGNSTNRNIQFNNAIADRFKDPNGWSEEQIINIMKADNRSLSTLEFLAKQEKSDLESNANYKNPNNEFIENQKMISKLKTYGNSKDGVATQTLFNTIANNKYQEFISLPSSSNRINQNENNLNTYSDLKINPNPSNGIIKLNLSNAKKAVYIIEIFDVFGKLIYTSEVFNSTSNELNTEIDLTNLNLSNGLYLINLNSENQKTSQRIVIEK